MTFSQGRTSVNRSNRWAECLNPFGIVEFDNAKNVCNGAGVRRPGRARASLRFLVQSSKSAKMSDVRLLFDNLNVMSIAYCVLRGAWAEPSKVRSPRSKAGQGAGQDSPPRYLGGYQAPRFSVPLESGGGAIQPPVQSPKSNVQSRARGASAYRVTDGRCCG